MRSQLLHRTRLMVGAAALLAATFSIGARQAYAQSVLVVGPVNYGPLTLPSAGTSVLISRFNTALGTLQSVQISLTTNLSGTLQVGTFQPGPLTWTQVTGATTVTASGPGATTTTNNLAIVDNTGGTVPPTYVSPVPLNSSDTDSVFVAPANFALYQGAGPGTYSININPTAFLVTGSGQAGVVYGGDGTIGGSVTVTYTYLAAAVPEASTLALLAPALLMGGVMVARRRRTA